MKPLARLSAEEVARLDGVLFDLDDTLLDHGVLTEAAYGALWRLSRAGFRLLAVTGRPAGWAEVMARQWPVLGVVAENGAVTVAREGASVVRHDACDAPTRRARRVRLARAFEHLRELFPEARLSGDTEARLTDIALDIGETQQVGPETVGLMAEEARKFGARTFVSTVHLHLTFDADDKASGAIAWLEERFGHDVTAARGRYAYLGDSANDAPAFAAFDLTIGVANVRDAVARLSVPPRYVASRPRGAGFAEIADKLLELWPHRNKGPLVEVPPAASG